LKEIDRAEKVRERERERERERGGDSERERTRKRESERERESKRDDDDDDDDDVKKNREKGSRTPIVLISVHPEASSSRQSRMTSRRYRINYVRRGYIFLAYGRRCGGRRRGGVS
jgi:hypothetical protein